MTEPRRLKGHKAATTCCIASRQRPGLIATAAEDGCVCWFDLRCKDVLFTMDVGNKNAISSLCFKQGKEDIIYVSAGSEVKCFDVNMAGSWKQLQSYNYNKDEINQITCNSKSSFLAAADDSGDVKIIDIQQQCPYKTLRAGHDSIVSSVQFIPWRPWEVITGGLDCKVVMWDFSKGRLYKTFDFGIPESGGTGQCLNPAFVHALIVPDLDMVDKVGKICVAARGDGVVDVINVQSASAKSRSSIKPNKSAKSTGRSSVSPNSCQIEEENYRKLQLDYTLGGHTAAVSCVTFSIFGEKGKYIISGGNDKSVKVWDWSRSSLASQTSGNNNFLQLNIDTKRKINWLCTTPCDSEHLIVCDTSKVVKVHSIT